MTRHFTPFLRVVCIIAISGSLLNLSAQYLEKVIPVNYHPEDHGATTEPSALICTGDGSKLYCAGDMGWTIVVDCATNRIIKDLPTAYGTVRAFYWQRNNRVFIFTYKGSVVIDPSTDSIVAVVPAGVTGVFNDSENCYLARLKIPDYTLPDQQIVDGFEKYFYGLAVLDGTTNQIRMRLRFTRDILDMVWNSHNNRYCVFTIDNHSVGIMTVIDGRTNRVIDSVVLEETAGWAIKSLYLSHSNKIYLTLSNALLIIDGATNRIIKRLPEVQFGEFCHLFYNSLSNKLYCFGCRTGAPEVIAVINCENDSVIKTLSVPGHSSYCKPVHSPTLNRLYFMKGNFIRVLDCNADTLFTDSVSVPGKVVDLCYNPQRQLLYATSHYTNQILVIDAENLQVLDTIRTGISALGDVVFNPLVNKLYVYSLDYNTLDNVLFILNADNGRLIKSIATGRRGFEGLRMCLHPEKRKLYCSNFELNSLSVIDCFADTVIKTIPVAPYPFDLTVNTTNHKLYSSHSATSALSVIDYDADTVIAVVPIPIDPSNSSPWIVWHSGVNKVYIEDIAHLNVVDGVTNSLLTTIPHRPFFFPSPPGACNLKDNKLYFTVLPLNFQGMFYSADAIADTMLDSISGYVMGATWQPVKNKAYFSRYSFILVIDGPTDSIIDSILLPGSRSQFPRPFSHPQASRVYWCLDANDSLNGGILFIDADLDTIDRLVQFPIPVGIANQIFGSGFDSLGNRLFVSCPTSHIYVFRDEIVGIQSGSSEKLSLQATVSPNPFRNYVEIRYHLPYPAKAEIKIFSADGRLVRLLNQADKQAGNHTFFWDGTDESRNRLPPGAYFIYLQANRLHLTRKILLTQ